MAVVKLNEYEVGVNADLSNALNNIDYNRIGIDTTIVEPAVFPATNYTIRAGFLLEVDGNLYTSDTSIALAFSATKFYISFDPSSLTFQLETSIGTFDPLKGGHYIGLKRVIRWSSSLDALIGMKIIQGMNEGQRVDQRGGVVLGGVNSALGAQAVCIGGESTSDGVGSIAIGVESASSGRGSIAIGDDVVSSGISSIAIGGGALSSLDYGVSFGSGANASGSFSTSIGRATVASGESSVAIGDSANADGFGGVAIGYGADSNGIDSIALGDSVVSSAGKFSFGSEQIHYDAPIVHSLLVPGSGSVLIPPGLHTIRSLGGVGSLYVELQFGGNWYRAYSLNSASICTPAIPCFLNKARITNNEITGITVNYMSW